MPEWILILTLNLTGVAGEIRDIAPTVITGFQSEQNCTAAASKVSERIIALAGKAREQQSIAKSTSKSSPAVWYECLNIRK